MSRRTTLTVLVPVYNEQYLVRDSLLRLKVLAKSPLLKWAQIVVVDDASRDASPAILRDFARSAPKGGKLRWEFHRHATNQGKGAAIRTALERAQGEVTVIHDADLEYHPEDILRMLVPFVDDHADAVFGSRFQPRDYRRVLHYKHELGNRFLTFLCNLSSDFNLTDMETCYKAVKTELLKSIPLESDDFRLEPELTLKLSKRHIRLYEVPINYSGRSYAEGKKINWRDGFRALGAIVKYSWSDRVYKDDSYNSRIFARLERAPRYNAWLARRLRPWLGQAVLQVGAATGMLAEELMPRNRWTAVERNPHYLERLRALKPSRPYLKVLAAALHGKKGLDADPGKGFDSLLSVNDLAYQEDDAGALASLTRHLAPGAKIVLVLPKSPALYGTLDQVLGHRRRYNRAALQDLARRTGLELEHVEGINRLGGLAWWLNSCILRRRRFPKLQIMTLNLIAPLLGLFDKLIPFPAQHYLVILAKGEPR